jgi:hypothetical protein
VRRQHCAREWRHGSVGPVGVAVRQQATQTRKPGPSGPRGAAHTKGCGSTSDKRKTKNSTVFDLQVPGAALRRTTGTNIFSSGSCVLAVGPNRDPSAAGGGSSFPVGFGPQPGEVLNLTTCEFDTEDLTLKVESNFGESTSSPAIPATITSITSGN